MYLHKIYNNIPTYMFIFSKTSTFDIYETGVYLFKNVHLFIKYWIKTLKHL